MAEVVMPRLSDTMEQGTVAKWLKKVGEPVAKGEPLVEIETDKANMVLEAYENGVLERIVVSEGQMVPIGEPIAYIASERAVGGAPQSGAAPQATPATPLPAQPAAPRAATTPEVEEGEVAGRIKVSPIARHIAQEHDVDLSRVHGTGPGGRITREDVEGYMRGQEGAPKPAAAPPRPTTMPAPAAPTEAQAPAAEGDLVPLTRMQATIARRMTESKTTAPHFYITNDVAMDAALELRGALNSSLGDEGKIGINDLVLKAAALALVKFPDVNASFHDGELEYHKHVNIGIAVSVPKGLVVPVLRDVDRKTLLKIAQGSEELIEKTRTNRLAPAEWEGGTFTVSNLGMYDVDEFAAIITPPQSGILAVASIKAMPTVVDEEIKIQRRMKLTLSVDHRVFYGAMAAEFLREVKRLLENPFRLLL